MPVKEKELGTIQTSAVRVQTGCKGQEKHRWNLFQIRYSFRSAAANYQTDATHFCPQRGPNLGLTSDISSHVYLLSEKVQKAKVTGVF